METETLGEMQKELCGLIRKDYPELGPITDDTIEQIETDRHRFRGGFRNYVGRVWTNAKYEARRRRVLSSRLP